MTRSSTPSEATRAAWHALSAHGAELRSLLAKYDAANPRVFGSVARGDARADSDIDLLVDLLPGKGNVLVRISGLREELGAVMGRRVDVVAAEVLRDGVARTALADAVPIEAITLLRHGHTP